MSAPAPSPAAVTCGAISAEDAIRSRRSIRAFLPTPVGDETVAAILELAARAPSGTNIQPWQVLVLRGEPLAALTRELHALSLAGDPGTEEFAYYPRQWREPYLSRRRKVGWDLYGTLGIAKGDTERMRQQLARNFLFFDAPVGLIFTIDRDLERGSWLDYGMFLQNIMIAARAFGFHTCPQAAFNAYGAVIARRLAIPDTQMIVCSMALGFADPEAPENTFTTVREPLENFVRFVDQIA
ncbi:MULTISPECIES: nitroreductase [Xanthobacter]|uniref:nitroreductase n=1 Tax=Xanthobacter TaxID=279 RepID=UPI0035B1B07A